MLKKWKLFRGLAGIFCFLFVLFLCVTVIGKENEGSVSRFFGIGAEQSGELTKETTLYKTDYTADGVPTKEGLKKLHEAQKDYIIKVSEEGSVLLYNNNAADGKPALPIAEKANVTLFGTGFQSPVYRGKSNGADYVLTRGINPQKAFQSVFTVNEEVLKAYNGQADNGADDGITLTDAQKATFANYGDAAIVMIKRRGGEGLELLPDNKGVNELAINDNEKKMLTEVKNGNFKKRIALINSGYPMEIECLKDYDIDACMWIGYPGLSGFQGVANLLCGKANPSGKLTDTYAASNKSSAAVQNFGDFQFANGTEQSTRYLIYAEGIYVGYKYYETRYEDLILGGRNADNALGIYESKGGKWNYADEISFPFGHGLSYTTFKQELAETPTYDKEKDEFTVKVKVANTGAVKGKSVVQVYAQVPYIEGKVEKAAIQVAGYGKTGDIEPGKDEIVTVTIDRYLLASYDEKEAKTYILDAGDYYLSVGDDAHDALNNVLAAKGKTGMYDHNGKTVAGDAAKTWKYTLDALDKTTYSKSDTGAEVTNRFTDDPIFASDYNYFKAGTVQYLTRRDWNTFPKRYEGLEVTDRMKDIHQGKFLEEIKPSDPPTLSAIKTEQTGDKVIKFYKMHGVPLTGEYIDASGKKWEVDELWDKFLSQMSLDDMALVTADDFGIKPVKSVSLPTIINQDGPDGVRGNYNNYDKKLSSTLFNSVNLLACTYSHELIRLRGHFTGEDALYLGVSQYWGPGFNNHRTPYGGRNFEYVSEDSVLAYYFAADVVPAMQEKGVICAPKHLAANNQETNRSGVMTFMTEQTLREITLKSFEGAYTIGHTKSTMTSYNAIGACFTARNAALMNEVVRGEWGYDGIFITDAGSCADTPLLTMACGTDMFCLQGQKYKDVVNEVNANNKDGYAMQVLRDSNKRFFYVYANSNAVNGLSESTVISTTTPWWLALLIAIDVIFGVVAVAALGLFVYGGYFRKGDKE